MENNLFMEIVFNEAKKEARKIEHGKIIIDINEESDKVDLIVEKRKRFYKHKKKRFIKKKVDSM